MKNWRLNSLIIAMFVMAVCGTIVVVLYSEDRREARRAKEEETQPRDVYELAEELDRKLTVTNNELSKQAEETKKLRESVNHQKELAEENKRIFDSLTSKVEARNKLIDSLNEKIDRLERELKELNHKKRE